MEHFWSFVDKNMSEEKDTGVKGYHWQSFKDNNWHEMLWDTLEIALLDKAL